MRKLIFPSKLNEGDKVAFISISGGRAGDKDMIHRYMLGKRRFERIFNVKVVETPNALAGRKNLYDHTEYYKLVQIWSCYEEKTNGIYSLAGASKGKTES